jgi:hypothetical protein
MLAIFKSAGSVTKHVAGGGTREKIYEMQILWHETGRQEAEVLLDGLPYSHDKHVPASINLEKQMKKKDMKRRIKDLEKGLYVAYFGLHDRVKVLKHKVESLEEDHNQQLLWNESIEKELDENWRTRHARP